MNDFQDLWTITFYENHMLHNSQYLKAKIHNLYFEGLICVKIYNNNIRYLDYLIIENIFPWIFYRYLS